MIKTFTFNGQRSSDFGLFIQGGGTFNSPDRDVDYITVPGRDGFLLLDNGRYNNVSVAYNVFVKREVETNTAAIRQWLLGRPGFHRLEDDFHPDEYRLASLEGTIDFNVFALEVADTVLTFTAKPQRWLKSGETPIAIQEAMTLENPTETASKPLILVNGAGLLRVGDIEVTTTADNTIIDSEIMSCYYEDTNLNNATQIEEFPVLGQGETEITFEGGITSVEITPRWWRL